MAKGKRICDQCGNKFATPRKLRDHLKRKFKCKPKPIQIPIQPFTTQVKDQVVVQEGDSEASPGPATQVYREEISSEQNKVQENDIVFVEKSYDLARPHKNLKNMSVWEGKIPAGNNPAYLYKKNQIKISLVIESTYTKYKYKGEGDVTDKANYEL
ncbi:14207_t:CDS:2, partial [Racocetra fulgida]